MMIDPKKMVTLNSPHFEEMRNELDRYISGALRAMDEKNMSAATIGLKIEIIARRETVKDDNAPTGEREALMPNITYKLALTLQAKAETKGDVVGRGYELVKDDTGSYYIMTGEEASGQLNLFNGWDEFAHNEPVTDQEDEDE